jgi:hypothetical protein
MRPCLCSVPVFESVGDQEIGESIFVEENEEDAIWEDAEPTSSAVPVESAMTISAHGPDPRSSTTWGPHEPPTQSTLAAPEEALAAVEGDATSSREASRHIQRLHPPQTMIGDISQHITRSREFEMSMMGELMFFLGLQIKQRREETFVHQGKYTKDLLRKFDMDEAKPLSMPMSTTTTLDEDKEGEAVDQKEYRSMIESLLYLTAIRPDI